MKSARKATACFLAFLLLLSVCSAAFAAAPTGTEKPDAATSGGVIDAALPVPAWAIPEGFHLTAQTFTDDTGKKEASCKPAEQCTAYKSDDDIYIPGEGTLHDDSCDPTANTCNDKRND